MANIACTNEEIEKAPAVIALVQPNSADKGAKKNTKGKSRAERHPDNKERNQHYDIAVEKPRLVRRGYPNFWISHTIHSDAAS